MAETVTQVDMYKATQNEMKLIEALSNPENKDLNISEVCELIGISRQAYYKMFKKPDFVKYYNEFQLELVKSNIGDVLKATIFFATNEAKCHQDRKMILEMGGVYTAKQEVDIGNKDNKPFKMDMAGLTTEELKRLANE